MLLMALAGTGAASSATAKPKAAPTAKNDEAPGDADASLSFSTHGARATSAARIARGAAAGAPPKRPINAAPGLAAKWHAANAAMPTTTGRGAIAVGANPVCACDALAP